MICNHKINWEGGLTILHPSTSTQLNLCFYLRTQANPTKLLEKLLEVRPQAKSNSTAKESCDIAIIIHIREVSIVWENNG